MKKTYFLLLVSLLAHNAVAYGADYRTVDEILNTPSSDTQCATGVFANALAADSNTVSEYDDEITIQTWIYDVFARPDVLNSVLNCPELKTLADDESIRFMPIQYNFPGGRQIIINYETQPKILKQRINLASKRSVKTLNDPNPKIGALDDDSIWTNTDPAWYAIMVVQHGALDEFVGPDKNNTVSIKYINDNIDKLYPHGAMCTSKSALARDDKIINIATHKTVDIEKDTNDYYVAGDANLQWISYAEIALDVVITVATMGGGAVITGVTKSARATRTLNRLREIIRTLSKSPRVVEYIKLEQKLQKIQQTIARIKKYQQIEKELASLDKVKDYAKIADKTKELEQVNRELREIDKLTDATKYTDKLADLEKEGKTVTNDMEKAVKTDKEVEQYVNARKSYTEIQQYRRAYKNFKNARAGNVATRAWRAFRATTTGNKTINRGAKIARHSIKSGRVRDWLFQSTLRNIGTLGRLETAGGALYGALKFVGDMYDWTETSTGDFTNDIEFKPLLLLSADDLAGQENVVNYGMWLMWSGDSTSHTDDDAAYLQAFDFADKFHMDLLETMDDKNSDACNVDIFVVRPVLRNPGNDNAEMYYLIMNDEPWSTVE